MKEITCNNCNGSGEGQHDGTRCYICKGKGTELIEIDDSELESEPDESEDLDDSESEM